LYLTQNDEQEIKTCRIKQFNFKVLSQRKE